MLCSWHFKTEKNKMITSHRTWEHYDRQSIRSKHPSLLAAVKSDFDSAWMTCAPAPEFPKALTGCRHSISGDNRSIMSCLSKHSTFYILEAPVSIWKSRTSLLLSAANVKQELISTCCCGKTPYRWESSPEIQNITPEKQVLQLGTATICHLLRFAINAFWGRVWSMNISIN